MSSCERRPVERHTWMGYVSLIFLMMPASFWIRNFVGPRPAKTMQ